MMRYAWEVCSSFVSAQHARGEGGGTYEDKHAPPIMRPLDREVVPILADTPRAPASTRYPHHRLSSSASAPRRTTAKRGRTHPDIPQRHFIRGESGEQRALAIAHEGRELGVPSCGCWGGSGCGGITVLRGGAGAEGRRTGMRRDMQHLGGRDGPVHRSLSSSSSAGTTTSDAAATTRWRCLERVECNPRRGVDDVSLPLSLS